MQQFPTPSRLAPFREPPAELMLFARSISDDDLCAWCQHLFYSPGDDSVCQRHKGACWPGRQDADGYYQCCTDFSPCTDNEAP